MLVSAMHITAGVWVNDNEQGILDRRAGVARQARPTEVAGPDGEVAGQLSPEGGGYRRHRGGEDNGDAHLKNMLVHHQVVAADHRGEAGSRALARGLLQPNSTAVGRSGWSSRCSASDGGLARLTLSAGAGRATAARRCGPAGAPRRRARRRPAGRCRRTRARAPRAPRARSSAPACRAAASRAAAWSIIVPKIDSVPSRLSISSSSRDWIGQSISDADLDLPEATGTVAAAPDGVDAVLVGVDRRRRR